MLLGLDSRLLFSGILLLVVVERLIELEISRRNARWAFANGAREFGAGHYRVMAIAHAAFLACCLGEVWLRRPPFVPWLGLSMLALCVGVMVLRYWVVFTLGRRWNTRVIVIPDLTPVTGGPYRWTRHPNYLAVIVEIAALPLIHSAWITATVFSVINAGILAVRIRVEEEALSSCSDYERMMADRRRLLPVRSRRQTQGGAR